MPPPLKAPEVYSDITYKIIGLGYSIHKELGPVHKERIYQEALAQEFKRNKIAFQREVQLSVQFKGEKVGVYVPDFVVEGKVIVELKAMEDIPPSGGTQLNYYLKATGYTVGLLLNFGARRLQVRRRVYG